MAAIPLLLLGVWYAQVLLEDVARPVRYVGCLVGAFVCLTPLILWEIFFPAPIDVTVGMSKIEYEFRDRIYAIEFAVLNDAWKDDEKE